MTDSCQDCTPVKTQRLQNLLIMVLHTLFSASLVGAVIGKGKVHQVQDKWYEKRLEELGTCVVDIVDLKADGWVKLPHPSETTGASFEDAEKKLGVMRVIWDSNKIFMLRPQ
ncbi:hypothetical protein F3Y22_tig00005974pilonHSYRG00322 [Hibiscus syriacus]|uniref:Nodulin homeobox C-terminal domain-containing protein n=1 Tax=Hibiscus syriacus TaxID=106335 RepID=A0A6A3CE38_HIBSY|nr:hypothetical protein F3Y22_tig00005974pilonHSYRG00322 [Hibiscus syriacus]